MHTDADPPAAARRLLHDLPAQPTPMIGRDAALASLRRLLVRPDVRLVTLTGPPGAGKTRLAVAAIATLVDDVNGDMRFIPLETVREPGLVIPAIAQALGLRETQAQSPAEALRAALVTQELLLVLDNFEQVIAAAAEVGALLAACPLLTILVTSRAPLRLRWEHELPVAPLELPAAAGDPALIAGAGAVQLFVARAQAHLPDFQLDAANSAVVATICRRLDGLPLAIELAAARLKLFSLDALLERLEHALALLRRGPRDLPPRHQTLHAAIAWSYTLLSPAEQALFRRLSVFAGGGTLEAAAAIAGQPEVDLLDGIASLVDQSLLLRVEAPDGEVRFRMLETIREYALERLAAAGEAPEVHWRHAGHFLALADRAYVRLRGPEMSRWMARLRRELDNLRAALAWSLTTGDGETALRMSSSLVLLWWGSGRLVEGRRWLERAFAVGDGAPVAVRARALLAAGAVAFFQGDHAAAAAAIRQGQALFEEIGTVSDLAWALALLANLEPDFAQRRVLAEESLALSRRSEDAWGIALAQHELGLLARDQGEYAVAAARLGEAAALGKGLGMARPLLNLGAVVQRLGAHDQAAAHFAEGLAVIAEVADAEGIARALQRTGELAAEREDLESSVRLLCAAAARFQTIGVHLRSREQARLERHLDAARTALGEPAFLAAQAEGRALSSEAAIAAARAYLATVNSPGEPVMPLHTPAPSRPAGLTDREIDVLRLIAAGKSTKAIAAALVISVHTVERHITHIYQKTATGSRAEATAYALHHGLTAPRRS